MKRLIQEINSVALPKVLFFACLIPALVPLRAAAADDLRKNIVVLVDESKSVDDANRKSALDLVAGLVTGKVAEASRQAWHFKAPDGGGDPAVLNLKQLVADGPAVGHPLALESSRFVIGALGNYERVSELIPKLLKPTLGSPGELANKLLENGAFKSSDNSTHISLAEAKVAHSFLSKPSKTPYYLIVISDFYEDCLNWPVKDYVPKAKELAAKNAKVLSGDEPFNDGKEAKKQKYTSDDIADIKFLNEKINGLLLGEFIYQGKAETPVNVKVYSPVVKRSLKLAAGPLQWILPDAPPSVPLTAEGLDDSSPLVLTLKNPQAEERVILKGNCGVLTDGKALDLAPLLDKPEMQDFLAAGNYELALDVAQDIGTGLHAATTLAIATPKIVLDDKRLRESTQEKPCEPAANKEIKTEKYAFTLDPAPRETHDVEIRSGKNRIITRVSGGTGDFTVGKFVDGAESNQPIKITASLKLVPTTALATASFWITIPKVTVWAVYDARIPDSDEILLDKTHSLTLKASHAGMEGYAWRGTTVVRKDSGKAVLPDSDDNHLDFSGVEPGTYLVTAKFGPVKSPEEQHFTVIVPKRTPWLLYALIGMVLASLGLFGWHFFRR